MFYSRSIIAAAALAAMASTSVPASASNYITISGTGVFSNTAAATPETNPGSTVVFSFDLPNPVTLTPGFGGEFTNPGSQIVNFNYSLDGNPVATPVQWIIFYPGAMGGGFNISFNDGVDAAFYGPDLETGGVLQPGDYTFALGSCVQSGGEPDCSGEPFGSARTSVTEVPEPLSLAVMSIGLVGLAAARRQAA